MIVLRLVKRPEGAPPGPAACTVAAGGSIIGRAPDCALVLDDPLRMVSRRHALLVPLSPREALLRCISTTATLQVNDTALPPGGECAVLHGDRLVIGGFELLVETPDAAAPAPPPRAPVSAPTVMLPPPPPPRLAPPPPAPAPEPARRARLDEWFDLDAVADPLGPGSPLPALDTLSRAMAALPLLRDPVSVPARPAPPPARDLREAATEGRSSQHADIELPSPFDGNEALRQALLHGAGLPPSTPLELNPDWMEHAGALLRAMTEGTLALLRSRAVTKRNLGAEGTHIVARENNMLKFAPDATEALKLLLSRHGRPGFLDPVEALHDAHDDLQLHQLAMVAGMRAAVFDLISRLGPETVEAAEGPVQGLARWLPALRDAALWRRHRQDHAQMLQNLDDAFEAAFGREFLRAYQAQAKPPSRP